MKMQKHRNARIGTIALMLILGIATGAPADDDRVGEVCRT